MGVTEGRGRSYPHVPVLQGVLEDKSKLRTIPGWRSREYLFPLLVLLTISPEFSASGVQCVTGRERSQGAQPPPSTSVVQWGPGAPKAMSSVCPTSAPTLPPGMAGSGQKESHPQSQLGGRQKPSGSRKEGPTCSHIASQR